ncbi:hypothetical protein DPMN_045241 [Dreissena polymorpha]|uniref:Uncharacterized protein n=1 Tax=Dreissena polymorpha TaxID=45954 RepID=A0A9D4D7E5_DREPO|nr:hypothetical protein DPMN_045241 [Dreissena polymorpha]
MNRGLIFVPGLSMTHMDRQGMNTGFPEPYTVATRTISDAAIVTDRYGSTRRV